MGTEKAPTNPVETMEKTVDTAEETDGSRTFRRKGCNVGIQSSRFMVELRCIAHE